MRKFTAIFMGILLFALTSGCAVGNENYVTNSDIETQCRQYSGHDMSPLTINDIQTLIDTGEIDEMLIFEDIEPTEEPDYPSYPEERPLIGVTRGATDNVGQILRVFSRGAQIQIVGGVNTSRQLLSYSGVFINCGSHDGISPEALREYVYTGGVVYASDHAGATIRAAFPGLFDYEVVSGALTVRNANVVHSELASHMGLEYFNIIFDLGGWYIITQMPDDATTYIQGYIPGSGITPLAISFNYGEGTVFFTSFHNSAQASGSMIDFIGYLVFRTLFVEAEEDMRRIAEEHGFRYENSVFGFFMQQRQYTELGEFAGYENVAGQFDAGAFGDAVMNAPVLDDSDMVTLESSDGFNSVFGDNTLSGGTGQQIEQGHFIHAASAGESFMLMIDTSLASFVIEMRCPAGNYFYLSARGELLLRVPDAPDFEPVIGRHGVIVRNAAAGDWGFRVIELGEEGEGSTVAIGIAVSSN